MVNDDVIRDESKSQWHHFMDYLCSETYNKVGMMRNTIHSGSAVLHSIERLDIGPIVQCSKASERGPMRDGDMQRTSVSFKTRMEHHFLCRIICTHQSEVWILQVSSSDDPKRSHSLKSQPRGLIGTIVYARRYLGRI